MQHAIRKTEKHEARPTVGDLPPSPCGATVCHQLFLQAVRILSSQYLEICTRQDIHSADAQRATWLRNSAEVYCWKLSKQSSLFGQSQAGLCMSNCCVSSKRRVRLTPNFQSPATCYIDCPSTLLSDDEAVAFWRASDLVVWSKTRKHFGNRYCRLEVYKGRCATKQQSVGRGQHCISPGCDFASAMC